MRNLKGTSIMRRAILAGAILLTAPLLPALPAINPPALAAPEATSNQEFAKTVAMSDMFEVESGQLAADQAGSARVKSFGQKMADDHSKTTDALEEIIDDEDIDVKLPDELDREHQAKIDQLKDLSGDAFDRAYIPTQVSAHQKAVDLFHGYAEKGENAALKQWAAATLPALKGHLDEAKQLSSEIKMAADDAEKAVKEEKRAATDKGADTSQRKDRAAPFEYVARQEPTDWTAQALIGRTVENEQGESLGDINNVILNEKGDVKAVTIGVGGFLGIGEKNVGVPFEALQFKTAVSDAADSSQKRSADDRDTRDNRDARFDSEHSNIEVVLNATKEQLESAPEFVWLDDQRSSERAVQ
jgi:putative membrane protein